MVKSQEVSNWCVLAGASLVTVLLWPERLRVAGLITMDPATPAVARSLALKLLGAVVAMLAIVASLDCFWQYREWFNRQKTSVRELKEEFKQSEGDPAIEAKIGQMRRTRMKKRMMAEVPKASVVIAKPTHYGIAPQDERGMAAPVCVAKGLDAVTLGTRQIAETHSVPIVETPPLARALHATVQRDAEIPPERCSGRGGDQLSDAAQSGRVPMKRGAGGRLMAAGPVPNAVPVAS